MNDDFYIGYRKEAPRTLARFVRGAALIIVSIVIAIAALIGALQQPAGDGKYDFGSAIPFEAELKSDPIPHAIIYSENGNAVLSHVPLVGTGKHGVPNAFVAADGKRVAFSGTNESRAGLRLIEVSSGPAKSVSSPRYGEKIDAFPIRGPFQGELIDTKCYLGVMNPGEGKVHRGCAALCLRGGVPPGLLMRDATGRPRAVFLAAKPGAINPGWAGRVIVVTGNIESVTGIPILHAVSISLR